MTEAKRGVRPWTIAVPLVAVGAAVAVYFASRDDGKPNGPLFTGTPISTTHIVTYLLSGSATSADITYNTPSGTEQQQGVDVPLTKETDHTPGIEQHFGSGGFLYISAQNNGDGTITCEIKVDGLTVAQNTASGEFAIATCEGSA